MGCFAHCLGLGFKPLLKLLNTATLQEDKLLQQTIYIYILFYDIQAPGLHTIQY